MELGTIFNEAGEELALVDGPVRGAFPEVTPHDFDMATSVRPEHTEELPTQWGNATWDIGKEFGMISGRRDDLIVKVTTYHTDGYEIGSRKPEVTFSDTLEGDLACHDFTVNAMAMRLPQMALVDPYSGLTDLADGNLRTPVSTEQSFDDDPLRIMRTARFSVQLSPDVDMDAMNVMETMALRLEVVSAECIRTELEYLIISPYPRRDIKLMMHTGVADIMLSKVAGLVSTVDEYKHHKGVYEHTSTIVKQAMDLKAGPGGAVSAPDFTLRFTALMHDVSKPTARRFEPNGTVSFHHHKIVGAKMARKRMKVLRFDKATIKAVSNLVALHLRFHGYGETTWPDSVVRRYVADAGDLLKHLHHLTCVDYTTHDRRKTNYLSTAYDDLETRIAAPRGQEELNAIRPNLDGDQIIEILGLRPSHAVKIARDYLLGLCMGRGPLGEEAARQMLLDWWASDDMRVLAEECQTQQTHWKTKVAEKKARKAVTKAARGAQEQ